MLQDIHVFYRCVSCGTAVKTVTVCTNNNLAVNLIPDVSVFRDRTQLKLFVTAGIFRIMCRPADCDI